MHIWKRRGILLRSCITEYPFFHLGAFWIFNGIALIVGGLISYGIGRMDPNTLGLHQWQWIMVILGAVTMFMGVFSFFFLIDNPKSRALRLNAEQEILVEERTRDNAVVRTTTIKHEHIREALGELRLWCFCFAGLFINLQNGAMTNYNAQITNDFGFDVSSVIDLVEYSIDRGHIVVKNWHSVFSAYRYCNPCSSAPAPVVSILFSSSVQSGASARPARSCTLLVAWCWSISLAWYCLKLSLSQRPNSSVSTWHGHTALPGCSWLLPYRTTYRATRKRSFTTACWSYFIR